MAPRLTPRERVLRSINEADWTMTVIGMAQTFGWVVHHSRPAVMQSGRWATALQGDRGLPDLVMAHPQHGVIFAELKKQTGVLDPDQERWAGVLVLAGARWYVWRPGDVDDVERILRGGS